MDAFKGLMIINHQLIIQNKTNSYSGKKKNILRKCKKVAYYHPVDWCFQSYFKALAPHIHSERHYVGLGNNSEPYQWSYQNLCNSRAKANSYKSVKKIILTMIKYGGGSVMLWRWFRAGLISHNSGKLPEIAIWVGA